MKFTNVKQIEEEFQNQSQGDLTVPYHESVRFEDIKRNAETLEVILESDYNEVSGFDFYQLLDVISHLNSNNINTYNADGGFREMNESFAGTLQAMTPTPIVNQGLVTYQYTNSVLPYLAYIFDMKGSNRAYAYYAKLKANKTIDGITSGDLLASPKQIGAQTINYAGTRVNLKEVDNLVSGTASYTLSLGFAPIKPGTLVINIEGLTGTLEDVTFGTTTGTAYLKSVNGDIGTATADLINGTVELTLTNTPSSSGDAIYASFNRDVETVDADTSNLADVTPEIEAVELHAEDFSIKTDLTLQQERAFAKIFGGNWNQTVEDMLGYIYNREVANRVVKDIRDELALTANATSVFTHDVESTTSTGDNRLFNAKFIVYPLRKLSTVITKASGLPTAKATTIVANQDVLPLLSGLDKFTEFDDVEENMGGMYLAGRYESTPVVATPESSILTSGEVLGLYKSKRQQFLTPAVIGNFILPVIRSVYDYRNMAVNRKQLIASLAPKVVAGKLAAKATISGIDTII